LKTGQLRRKKAFKNDQIDTLLSEYFSLAKKFVFLLHSLYGVGNRTDKMIYTITDNDFMENIFLNALLTANRDPRDLYHVVLATAYT